MRKKLWVIKMWDSCQIELKKINKNLRKKKLKDLLKIIKSIKILDENGTKKYEILFLLQNPKL